MGPDGGRLRVTLDLLDEILLARAPDLHRVLRPGLNGHQIQDFLEPFRYDVPDVVRVLYSWHDGAELVDGPQRAELFPNAEMLPLSDAIRTWSEVVEAGRAGGRNLWDPHWLPLFAGYKWAFWVVDCGQLQGPVKVFDWVDLPETWTAYADLGDMSARVLQCWSDGAYRQGSNATVDEDRHKAAAINRAMDQPPADIDRLIADLATGTGSRYGNALALLRTRLYPDAVPGLIHLMNSKSRGRIAAAELLGWIGGREALECLERVSELEPDDHIRDYARHALQESKLRSVWSAGSG